MARAADEFARVFAGLVEGRLEARQAAEDPRYQQYMQEAQAESKDLTHLGLPIPLLVFGFSAGGHGLAIKFVEHVVATRQQLSTEQGVYFPVLGLTDGQGSVSPTQPMPYAFAMATGLTAAGLRIAADKAIEGRSMAGCGFRDTAQVVEVGGQRGCVVLDLSEQKATQTKMLPGLLKAAELGYYAVVVGKRSEKVLSALKSAFPAGRLLLLPSSAVQGASGADKAASVAASLVDWYLGQEEVQRELARRAERAQRTQQQQQRPARRGEVQRQREALHTGGPCCPCGCSEEDRVQHTSGTMVLALSDPQNAVRRMSEGDADMAAAIGNVIGTAVEAKTPGAVSMFESEGLVPVLFTQLQKAREAPVNYGMWGTCIGVLTNASRFEGQEGDRLRAVLLEAGMAEQLTAARGSRDARVREWAKLAIEGLQAFGCWARVCDGCGRREEREGEFKRCSGCKQVVYCSRECQVQAWKEGGHKAACKQLAAHR